MPENASLLTMEDETESAVNGPAAAKNMVAGANFRHLVHVFPTFGNGGVPIRIANIINHFGDRYRHTIISLDGETGAGRRLNGDMTVAYLSPPNKLDNYAKELWRHRSTLRRLVPDLLLTYNWGAIEWALVNSWLPICRHIHLESGFGPEEADRQLPRRVLFRRLALRRTSAVVVPSRTLVDLATRVWKLPPGKVVHIPNGIDLVAFAGPPDPTALPGFVKAPGELVVGTLAPLRREKNLAMLVRVFAAVAGDHVVRLLIIGDGKERPALEALAGDLGVADRVVFAGHVDRPEAVLGLIDVFALTSDTEQMPNSLIQAMAASRPVAAVDVGDVRTLLAEENHPFVCAKGDERGFVARLDRLLRDPESRAALGLANRARAVRDYDQERMFRAYARVFEA